MNPGPPQARCRERVRQDILDTNRIRQIPPLPLVPIYALPTVPPQKGDSHVIPVMISKILRPFPRDSRRYSHGRYHHTSASRPT